jgi:hypothetical protein
MNKVLEEFLSLSATTGVHPSSWIEGKKKEQNVWRKKSNSYKTVIDRMLFSGGDFVFIPQKGDLAIDILAKNARKFKSLPKRISNSAGVNPKAYLAKYSQKDPKRYRICVGYCLIIEQRISFWTRHYWLYDKQAKVILECTKMKPRFYYGVLLSEGGTNNLAQSIKN